MKSSTPKIAIAAFVLAIAAAIAVMRPGPSHAAGSPSLTSLPNTTVVNGKRVKLHVMKDGLRYYDIVVGKGPHPKPGQTVSVLYYGTLLNGTVFDASSRHGGQPIQFPIGVGQVIRGWDEGVPPMRVGGKRRLVIPGDLAYGSNPPSPVIPPNATLVFDIKLVGVS